MNPKTAITEFSQCEKIKAGIIWISNTLNLLPAMTAAEKRGAEAVAKSVIAMIGREAHLARKVAGDTAWMNAEKNIDMAMVMIESGVAQEASYHLTQALQQVTGRAQRAMTVLVDQGLM